MTKYYKVSVSGIGASAPSWTIYFRMYADACAYVLALAEIINSQFNIEEVEFDGEFYSKYPLL